jgi:hypothetical protein
MRVAVEEPPRYIGALHFFNGALADRGSSALQCGKGSVCPSPWKNSDKWRVASDEQSPSPLNRHTVGPLSPAVERGKDEFQPDTVARSALSNASMRLAGRAR